MNQMLKIKTLKTTNLAVLLLSGVLLFSVSTAQAGELFHLNRRSFDAITRSFSLGRIAPRVNVTKALESTVAQRLTNPFATQNRGARVGGLKTNYYERQRLLAYRSVEEYKLKLELWKARVQQIQEIQDAKRLKMMEKAQREQAKMKERQAKQVAAVSAPPSKPTEMKSVKITTASEQLNERETGSSAASSAIYKLGLSPKTSILDSLKQALFGR